LQLLENMIAGLKTEIRTLKTVMDKISDEHGKFDEFVKSLKNFVLNKEERVKNLESQVIKINDDLVMIKGKKNGSGSQN
jgi:hypothetical protein